MVPSVSGLVDLGLPCAVGQALQGGITNGSYSSHWALSPYWLTVLKKLLNSLEWAPQGLDCPQSLSHVSSLRLDD